MRLVRPDGAEVFLGSLLDQVYSFEDDDGTQYHWSVAEASRRALLRGQYWTVSLSEIGLTCASIRARYQGLDEARALTRDLSKPLLFVPFKDSHQLIDGWHRLFKAAKTGVDVLPALVLTQEDADASLIVRLAPGHGLDWGQAQDQQQGQGQSQSQHRK